MKLLIIGHGRHGKDTVSAIMSSNYGLSFTSSSAFCSKLFIYDMLKDKYGYNSEQECYNDRHNHRAEWFDLICAYNKDDQARLGREIFKENDIYCGLRNYDEFAALKREKVFNYTIWVDRSLILPLEAESSMNLTPDLADFYLDNNGSLVELYEAIRQLVSKL